MGWVGLAAILCSSWPLFVRAETVEASTTSPPDVARFAVVVGFNGMPSGEVREKGLRRLRYADDDALRFARLFERAGIRSWVLTDPDTETSAQLRSSGGPSLAIRYPSPDGLRAVMGEATEAMARAEALGEEAHLFFVYSGHGAHRPDGQVVFALPEQDLDRALLFDDLLARTSTSAVVHLVIDACYAEGFVGLRGSAEDTSDEDYQALARRIQRRPRVGALLASSANEEAQEWEGVRAGVFTYELVSGLLGPADGSNDGTISYSEIEAFVDAANAQLSEAVRHRFVSIRPKEPRDVALMDWRVNREPGLVGDASFLGRFRLSTPDGQSWADAHGQPGYEMYLALPEAGGVLRTLEPEVADKGGAVRDQVVNLPKANTLVPFDSLALDRIESDPKGVVDTELQQKLFEEPFGPSFLAGYTQGLDRGLIEGERTTRVVIEESRRSWPGYALLTAGAASLVGSGITLGLGLDARETYLNAPSMAEADDARSRAEALFITSAITGGLGVLGAALGLWLWE